MCDQFKVIPSFELSRQAEIRAPSETEAFSMNVNQSEFCELTFYSEAEITMSIGSVRFLSRTMMIKKYYPEQWNSMTFAWALNEPWESSVLIEFINLNRYHFHIESIHKTNTCSWKHRVNPRSSKFFFCGLPNNFILVNWTKGRNSTPKGKITPQEF